MKPADNLAYRFPVSIKAVIFKHDTVILLKNERDEFELPGGKLEVDEQPLLTLEREIKEELSINVRVIDILDSWLYHIDQDTHVVIITYFCEMLDAAQEPKLSIEHKMLYACPIENLQNIIIPKGYVNSINLAIFKKSKRSI